MSDDGILLLGGGGFIGTALSRRLAQDGRRVHVVARQSSTIVHTGAVVHTGDLGDDELLATLLEECSTVVHLAATTTPGTSAVHPAKELETLAPTLRLLEELQSRKDVHLVFISSGGTVYGNPASNPVTESSPLIPSSYHGAGKVALEAFFDAFRAGGHPVTVLRLSNTYGPEQQLNQGFGLIRTVLQHILRGTTMEIWGDGENIRDFIYIDDVTNAIATAIGAPADSGTYNVGSGRGYTLNRVLDIAERICGASLCVASHPARSIDVRQIVLDISRIHSTLGWSPCISLEEGIEQTWKWLQDHERA
jgi:UDP-glucose 4-epimerase